MGAGTTDGPIADGAGRAARAAVGRQVAPTLAHRELGMRLRELRVGCGLTVEEAAKRLVWPLSRIRQLEEAADLPTETDLRELRTLFKLDDPTADQLAELTRDAREPGWWADYQDLGVPYIGLEQHASAITSYTMQYLPALLQTENYARAIIMALAPHVDRETLKERVEARLRRQQVLNGPSKPRYTVLIDEAVLHRPVGGRAAMYNQLDKVLTLIRSHQVELRIMPFEHGASVAQDSNFVLLQFGEPGPLPAVYVEGLATYRFLEDKQSIDRYSEEIERLNRWALDLGESAKRIEQARDAYRGDR